MTRAMKSASAVPGWVGIVLGLLPLLIWLLLMIIIAVMNILVRIIPGNLDDLESSAPVLVVLIFILGLFTLAAIVTAGGLLGWPSWTFSNGGLLLAVTALIQMISMNNGGTVMGNEVGIGFPLSWSAWISEVVVVLVILVIRRSLNPFRELFQVVKRDWTLLSFAIYAILPVAFIFAFDEVRNETAIIAVMILFVSLGALGFLRTPQVPWRFIWLAAFFWFSWALGGIYTFFYWRGRGVDWMPAPANGWDQMFDYLAVGGFILVLLCLPGLVTALAFAVGWLIRKDWRYLLRPHPPANI